MRRRPKLLLNLFDFLLVAAIFLATALPTQAAPQKDAAGCSKHPLFSRMANMPLTFCKTVPFDAFKFKTGKNTDATVEDRCFEIRYKIQDGFEAPSPLASVASNDTEEGRARNRRAELVKQ